MATAMRPLRTFLVLALVACQLCLGSLRGQAVLLETPLSEDCPRNRLRDLALHVHLDVKAHGAHSHDDVPLHMHVPEDEVCRTGARKLVRPAPGHDITPPTEVASVLPVSAAMHPSAAAHALRRSEGLPLAIDRALRAIRLRT
jgi:hypothetical protein